MDRRCVQPRLTVSHPNILIISEVPGRAQRLRSDAKNHYTGWPRERIRYFYNRAQYRDLPKGWTSGSHPYRVRQDGATPCHVAGPHPRMARQLLGNLATAQRERLCPRSGVFLRALPNHYQLCGLGCPAIGQPHVLHVMDEPFFHAEPALVDAMLQRVRNFFTIGETMRRAYYERYGRDSQVFHNGAEPEFFNPPARLTSDSSVRCDCAS